MLKALNLRPRKIWPIRPPLDTAAWTEAADADEDGVSSSEANGGDRKTALLAQIAIRGLGDDARKSAWPLLCTCATAAATSKLSNGSSCSSNEASMQQAAAEGLQLVSAPSK